MAIQRAEGFFHFNSWSDWAAKGHNGGGGNSIIENTGGRGGRGCASIGLNNSMHIVYVTAQATSFATYAWRCDTRVAGMGIGSFRNATNTHLQLIADEDGSISVYQCNPPFNTGAFLTPGRTLLGTSDPNYIRSATWHHLEVKGVISTTVGEVQIYVDGIEALHITGAYTYGNGGAVNSVQYGFNGTSIGYHRISDLLISDTVATDADGNATPNTSFLGDLAVWESVTPSDGSLLQWTRSTGAGTWSSHIDENPQDGDASYLSSASAGQIQTHSFPTVSSDVGTVVAVKNTVCHRKESPSFATLRLVSRSTDAVNHFSDIKATTETYKFDEIIHEKDPRDASSWSTTKVNNTQLGFEHQA